MMRGVLHHPRRLRSGHGARVIRSTRYEAVAAGTVIDDAYTIELSHGARIEPLVRDADGAALGGLLAQAIAQEGVRL
jgi:hypothetical protein